MGLFSSKPQMQTTTLNGKTFQYMEFVKGYPLPDDIKILENMVAFYRKHNSFNPSKSDIRGGYVHRADYHDILIKYFQLELLKYQLEQYLHVKQNTVFVKNVMVET